MAGAGSPLRKERGSALDRARCMKEQLPRDCGVGEQRHSTRNRLHCSLGCIAAQASNSTALTILTLPQRQCSAYHGCATLPSHICHGCTTSRHTRAAVVQRSHYARMPP